MAKFRGLAHNSAFCGKLLLIPIDKNLNYFLLYTCFTVLSFH